MDKLKNLYQKYKEQILYVFFGGLTTVVNYTVFAVITKVFGSRGIDLSTPSVVIAWVASVAFAYITNRIWVFESKKAGAKAVLAELTSFFAFRLLSLFFDILFMYITVDLLKWNTYAMKLLSNVFVVIMNYFFSKLFIFNKPQKEKNSKKM